MMRDQQLIDLSVRVGDVLKQAGLKMAAAESCTGGWIAEVVTQTAGSSAWFDCGWVTYSNTAKMKLLGVSASTLREHGAVSEATAAEMVIGALARSDAQVALSVTGIAGPDGGTADKPVGTVCFGWCRKGAEAGDDKAGAKAHTARMHFSGDRTEVRRQSVIFALESLLQKIL